MKAEELRTLDAEELGGRLKGARRELYELRFKLAVGQLENHRQILKVRKDIARILTVIHQRELDAAVEGAYAGAAAIAVEEPETPAETVVTDGEAAGDEEATPEAVEATATATAAEAEPETEKKPRRRAKKSEEES